jgi:hypothetical protein
VATPTETKQGNKKGEAPVALRPFLTGTQPVEQQSYDETETLIAGSQTLRTYYVRTDGFLDRLYIEVVCTTAGNSAAVAFNEDAPWNAIQSITFNDTTNKPIVGPFSGFDLKEWIKYGGFCFLSDPAECPATYGATTGSGATGGSFKFMLVIPLTFVAREALGALPNTSNQTVYSVDITLNSTGEIYSTAPTNAGSVRVKIHQDGFRESAGVDIQGNPTQTTPPALGAVQYCRKFSNDISSGAQNFRLSPWEGMTRMLAFILRDSDDTRTGGEADFPDPLRIHYDNNVPYNRAKSLWRRKMIESYGYKAAIDTPGGRDSGVYVLPYHTDWGLMPGQEGRYAYLPVSAGTSIVWDGNVGGSGNHKLETMVNYINPPGGSVKALSAR